eukprot:SAG31_NODE_1750_length_7353_cov_17.309209_5_plen_45_part_00
MTNSSMPKQRLFPESQLLVVTRRGQKDCNGITVIRAVAETVGPQ